jgi:hypothetical protein
MLESALTRFKLAGVPARRGAWHGTLGAAAFSGAIIGCVDRQLTVPPGVQAEIDADAGTRTMLESAVV